jgi:crotonobetainyl-CoA:carnitine CoA-transferase CaiB-like acyl-CoA transferase
MSGVMQGVKVLELAAWTFVPAAGAVLADWGADVIKVEHPETGDPQRGLSVGAVGARGVGGVSFIMEQPNRGKRSIGLDFASEDGRALLLQLAAECDVFVTNLLPGSLERARLTVADLRAANPKIIYARGTGYGVRGPEANMGGFDGASYFSRGGVAGMLHDPAAPWPPMQRPAFGDIVGGFAIASGIAAALYKREKTGEPSVVDVSLLGLAAWQISPDLVATGLLGEANLPRFTTDDMPNPLVNYYRTSDDRYVQLMFLQADKLWPDACRLMDKPEWKDDPRFATGPARFENRVELISEMRKVFEQKTVAEWREILATAQGVWAVVQTPQEVLDDVQTVANGYLRPVTTLDGDHTYDLVANPVQFDETPPDLVRAPDAGQHTDELLLELGLDYDRIVELKVAGVIN